MFGSISPSKEKKKEKRAGPNTYICGLDTTYNDLGKLPRLIQPQSDVNSSKSKQNYECINKIDQHPAYRSIKHGHEHLTKIYCFFI